MSKGVTPKSENYARWYTDVITKAEMADYGPVKGTMVIRPYGFGVWDTIKEAFDEQFKKLKVELTPRTVDAEMIIRDMTGNEFNGFSWTSSSFFNELENNDETYQHPPATATTSTNL